MTSSSPPLTGDGPARTIASNLPLLVYTGATIVAGLFALIWASLTFVVWPSISLTPDGREKGVALGLLFWIVLGLLGGMRVKRMHGYGVLTFHLPFIIAATALGGPVAGGWVAMISTLEIRELREVPWYGNLANHTGMALSAVLAGVVFEGVRNHAPAALTDQPRAAELLAIVLATLVLAGLSSGLATGTRILRDHLSVREAVRLMDTSFRTTSASEVVMGWVLTVAYGTIGWWAAVVCATLVLVLWQAHDDRETARHDAMTGLLGRSGFDARLEEIIVRVRRGSGRAALLAIDLDGFKRVNDTYGHGAGDAVIREIGARLRDSIRLTDAAVRRGGDEFGVLLAGITDEAAAEQLATRIWRALCLPIATEWGDIEVGASVGVIIIDPAGPALTVDRFHALADHEMYAAKLAGGGVRVGRPGSGPVSLPTRSATGSNGIADVS